MANLVSDPTIWSARIQMYLDKNSVYFAALGNSNYEGEIRDAGSTVKIFSVGDVTISDYTGTLAAPEELDDSDKDLIIDQRKSFNFFVDDVDQQRSMLPLIDLGSQRAAYGMRDTIDRHLATRHAQVSATNNVGTSATPVVIGFGATDTKPYDAILRLGQALDEASVQSDNRRVVVPFWFHTALKRQLAIKDTEDGSNQMRTGVAAINVDGIRVYGSANVSNTGGVWKIIGGLPEITFAMALTKVETYRPEAKFATGIKGLNVFGSRVVQDKAMSVLSASQGSLFV